MTDYTAAPIHGNDRIQEWNDLVARSTGGTIFHQSWWLEAAGREFQIIGVSDDKGRIVGGLPLTLTNRYGLRLVRNPPLTPYLGPVFDIDEGTTSYKSISLMRNAGAALADSISNIDSFSQHLGPNGPDLQAFLWRGFSAELCYTFRIDKQLGADEMLNRMHPKHRSELLKAERRGMQVVESNDLDTFLLLNRKTFERTGVRVPYPDCVVRSLFEAARSRAGALLLLAKNAAGKITDGAIFFFDSKSYYLVLAGGDPDFRGDGGGNAVIWEGIQRALASNRDFDFEGSAIPNVEFFYRRWGGIPCPTIHLHKSLSRKAYLAGAVKSYLARA